MAQFCNPDTRLTNLSFFGEEHVFTLLSHVANKIAQTVGLRISSRRLNFGDGWIELLKPESKY